MANSSFRSKGQPFVAPELPSHPAVQDRAAPHAHPATAIDVTPSGLILSTNVQAALQEVSGAAVQASVLTVDGNLLTRAAGVPAEITRDNLAADPAFMGRVPFRNMLDNGATVVNQRGIGSITGVVTDGGQRVVDRWLPRNNAAGTYTFGHIFDGPTNSAFNTSFKMTCTTADASLAAGDFVLLQQNIEGLNLRYLLWGTSQAKPVTVSFWVKMNTTGTFVCELFRTEATVRTIGAYFTVNAANTWEYKTVTFPGDTTTVPTWDLNSRLSLVFWLAVGSTYSGGGALQTSWGNRTDNLRAVGCTNLSGTVNNFAEFTGIQLEIGLVATPFESLSYPDELARCQRYAFYPGYVVPAANYSYQGTGFGLGATSAIFTNSFPVSMRAIPAWDLNATTGAVGNYKVFDRLGGNIACTNLALDVLTGPNQGVVTATVAAGLVAGNLYHLAKDTGLTGNAGWTADI